MSILAGSAAATAARADCATDTNPTCSYVAVKASVCVTPTVFGIASPVSENVTNSCAAEIMVPTGSQAEWMSFVQNHESCASLSACGASPANGVCGSGQYQCSSGTATAQSDSGSASTWTCSGSNGGADSEQCQSCDSGYTPAEDGICAPSNLCYFTVVNQGKTVPVNGNPTVVALSTESLYSYNQDTGASTFVQTEPIQPDGTFESFNVSPLCSAAPVLNGVCGVSAGSCLVGQSYNNTASSWTCAGINGGADAQCQVGTVVPVCAAGTLGLYCLAGTMTHYDEGGADPENWHCTGVNAPDALCVKFGINPHQP